MRKNVFGRRLNRDKNERRALFKTLISSLVLSYKIKTTEEKAKAIKGQVDKLVTIARKGKHHVALLAEYLNPDAIKKLVSEITPQLEKRNGGYTRLVRLGQRQNDNATSVMIEWVEDVRIPNKDKKKSETEKVSAEAEIKADTKKKTLKLESGKAEKATAKEAKSTKKTAKSKSK